MKKRILLTLFLLIFSGTRAFSQLDVSPANVINLSGTQGDTVIVPLILTNDDSIAIDAWGLLLTYPESLLTYQGIDTVETLTGNWLFVDGQVATENTLNIGGAGLQPFAQSGVLVKVMFTETGAQGSGEISLANFVNDIENATTTNGQVNVLIASVSQDKTRPTSFTLSQNYPNPFNPETKIDYTLPEAANVSIAIYNLQGQLIRQLVNGEQAPGFHSVSWNGRNNSDLEVASGVYVYTLKAGKFNQSRKLTFIR